MAGFDNITLQTSTPQCCIIHTLTLCSQQYEMKVAAKHTLYTLYSSQVILTNWWDDSTGIQYSQWFYSITR